MKPSRGAAGLDVRLPRTHHHVRNMPGGTALLDRVLGHRAARIAVQDHVGQETTAGALQAASAQLGRALLDGRRSLAGARVALLMPPSPAFVAALFGVWRAGGVAVPLSASHAPAELEHILGTAAPEATIVSAELSSRLDAGAAPPLSAGRRLPGPALDTPGGDPAGDGVAPDLAEPSPALMLFTSGTTGKPKGVTLSHGGVAATLSALAEAWRWREDDHLLHALPLYHTHGLIVALLGALWAGARVELRAFEARDLWSSFERASVFMAVPTMYVRLCEAFTAANPAERDRWATGARALRLCTSGSAALPAPLMRTFEDATGQTILERYGMTEIGMALSNPYDGPRIPGTVGVPLPGVSVDIVDDAGHEVARGMPGELRVRSPQLFLGYHADQPATAAAFDEDGRFRTGDTGMVDPAGHIRLLGRTSVDILKSGGYKLSALEIEEALAAHPAIAEVAVIGTPDPVWGDAVTACVVTRPGAGVELDDLRAWARDRLAPYKLPRLLQKLPALPRNGMGKVQKSVLMRGAEAVERSRGDAGAASGAHQPVVPSHGGEGEPS
jgi:malonyl-CoA/methylmalonyl-CoA synthetase